MTSKDVLFQIKLAMLYKDVLQKDIAEKTGINIRTLQRRFENPSGFTIDELIKISEMLNIKFEFVYDTISFQPSISPYIVLNNGCGCEDCWWYQHLKHNPNPTITAGDTPCTWCHKLQPTCEATNNDK